MSSFASLRTTPRGIYPLGMTKKRDPSATPQGDKKERQGDCEALRVTKKGAF